MNLHTIRQELREYLLGFFIKEVTWRYLGFDGNKTMEYISFDHLPPDKILGSINESAFRDFEVFVFELLRGRFSDWEKGYGSKGFMEWDLLKDNITGYHLEDVIQTEACKIKNWR